MSLPAQIVVDVQHQTVIVQYRSKTHSARWVNQTESGRVSCDTLEDVVGDYNLLSGALMLWGTRKEPTRDDVDIVDRDLLAQCQSIQGTADDFTVADDDLSELSGGWWDPGDYYEE